MIKRHNKKVKRTAKEKATRDSKTGRLLKGHPPTNPDRPTAADYGPVTIDDDRFEPNPNTSPEYDRLTPRQKMFLQRYLIHFNATRASLEARYKRSRGSGQHQLARTILQGVKMQAAIKEQLDQVGITAEKVKSGLAEIAFGGGMVELEDWLCGKKSLRKLQEEGVNTDVINSLSMTAGLQGTSRTLRCANRLTALKELVRILGIAKEGQMAETTQQLQLFFSETQASTRKRSGGKPK